MKMTYIRIIVLAYFFSYTLNWQLAWGQEKQLLNNFYEKLKSNVSLKQMWTVNNLPLPRTNK